MPRPPNHRDALLAEALAAIARGWPLTPLRGKVPLLTAWTTAAVPDEAQLREWLTDQSITGLGLRTGRTSGVFVLDRDTPKGAAELELPRTVSVATPTGGAHFYFNQPCDEHGVLLKLGNSASRIAPHWDTRGDGGQVVYPGSTHPSGGVYGWLVRPDETPLATLPAALLAKLLDPPSARSSGAVTNAYSQAALVRESSRVRNAYEDTRNHTLNRAAFSLGQLVAGGELLESDVRAELEASAILAGLPLKEATRTISSGIAGGMQQPRRAPERTARAAARTVTVQAVASEPTATDVVLIPGAHVLPPFKPGGSSRYVEVSPADFSDTVFCALPADIIFRRGGIPGEIVGGEFQPISVTRMRILASRCIKFGAGIQPKSDEADPVVQFRSLSHDHGAIIGAGAQSDERVQVLDYLTPYPICLPDWTISPPGYSQGVYYTGSICPQLIQDHEEIRALLQDLVADFPFQEPADLQNFIGLLLTPIVRYAIRGPAPMHMIVSPMERTGKTKLAEMVLGYIALGQPTPVFQLGSNEEERDKRITAGLLAGETLLLLDNLSPRMDSPALASLLTSNVYRGRILQQSRIPALPNHLTVVATGNNITASSEIAKRIVPIRLWTASDHPERRSDFHHPDLRRYLLESRERHVGALLGMVANWVAAGRPTGSVAFGGFETWSQTVGGILKLHGFDAWMGNADLWREDADEFSADLSTLVAEWLARNGAAKSAAELFDLARELEVFPEITGDTVRGRNRFYAVICPKLKGRPVGQFRIVFTKGMRSSVYSLDGL